MNEHTKQLGIGILIGIAIAGTIAWLLLTAPNEAFFSGQYTKNDLLAQGFAINEVQDIGLSHGYYSNYARGSGNSVHYSESFLHDQYTTHSFPGGKLHDISTWSHYSESAFVAPRWPLEVAE